MSSGIEDRMSKAVEATQREWTKIRTGQANPSLLDVVMVNYYGTATPVSHLAKISVPEPRVLAIAPWEKNLLAEIEKGIMAANLGLTPTNDGDFIRITMPILTQERRQDLAKQARAIAEEGKVAIRNIRRDENDSYKKSAKDSGVSEDEIKKELDTIQKITDRFIAEIDELCKKKEADILKV
jgi:ribosome recycling factor